MVSEFISRIDIFLEIKGKARFSCQLKRHLSPRTVGLITRALPICGNAHHLGKSVVYMKTKINSGMERKKIDFKKGDVAYLPTGGCICIYLNDVSNGEPMTPIGKLTTSIDSLIVKPGDVLSLYSEIA